MMSKRKANIERPEDISGLVKISKTKKGICCLGRINYAGAAISTWAVGNILGYVNYEISQQQALANVKTFCVGHSLGGHMCGFFGKMANRLLDTGKGLRKIIALDPAGP